MLYILLDGRRFASKETGHRYLCQKLGPFRYHSPNLDALHDALTSLPPCRIRLRHAATLRKSADGYGSRILQVLADSARENPGIDLILS